MSNVSKFSLLFLFLLCLTAQAQQKTNPHTQIAWPATCSGPHMVYNYVTNQCISTPDTSALTPGPPAICANGTAGGLTPTGCTLQPTQVTWPGTCATGVYVPATNTCVPTGTAANPAPATGTLQMNAGGVFGPVNNSNADTNGNVALASIAANPNGDLYVKAYPYNAKCDDKIGGGFGVGSAVTITAGVTSGYTFTAADVGKVVKGMTDFRSNPAVAYQGTILSVTGGNATLSNTATITLLFWDYGTDDRGPVDGSLNPTSPNGIARAFADALTLGKKVQFPAGSCLMSTIKYQGQTLYGAGISVSSIMSMPGQDVFQAPDGPYAIPVGGTFIHDIWIKVDNTVDASAAPQGNNTFPNRIAGNLGGGVAITPAISTGPAAFGNAPNGYPTGCTALINSGNLSALVLSGCPPLNVIDQWRVIGAPITIQNVGPSGGPLTTTIASLTGANTINLATPATSSGTGLSGTYLNPIVFPLPIGNCAFAYPSSNGAGGSAATYPQFYVYENVAITQINGPQQGNHSCGMFFQAPPYGDRFSRVRIQNFWGAYIEAYPNTNPGGSTWTGDTSSYKDLDFYTNAIPFVIMAGNHRTVDNLNIYGGATNEALGPFWLDHGSTAQINRLYFECTGVTTGEISRFTGDYGINIAGGSTQQCGATAYVLWAASKSTVNAAFFNLQVAPNANLNNFTNIQGSKQYIVDNGWSNSIQTNQNTSPFGLYSRTFYANRPITPAGAMDASYLLSGNITTQYLNANDLNTRCQDWGNAINVGATDGTCNPDPTGTELSQSYFRSAGPITVADSIHAGGVTNAWTGVQRYFGTNVPQVKTLVAITARCVGSGCAASIPFQVNSISPSNVETTLTTVTLNLTAAWSTTYGYADMTAAVTGNNLGWRTQTGLTNTGTNYDIASWAIEPLPADFAFRGTTVGAIGGSALAAGACATGTSTGVIGVVAGLTGNAAPVDGTMMAGYVITAQGTAAGTATVSVCAIVAGTPPAKNYNWRLFP